MEGLEGLRLNSLLVAGVDEAGRGPLAGPVVAAAVILPKGYNNEEIKDSKCLSPLKREKLFELLRREALSIGISLISPREIDANDILWASLQAMRKAVLKLTLVPELVLVDGIHPIPDINIPQKAIPKGDSKYTVISAASIVAKVIRDRIMCAWDKIYPQYGFAKHKGYPTREHREAIMRYGPSPIHRLSFKGVVK
ncbi:MAG: ribonuclease HII [Synergistetes bacterium]|nr:ribonuclease HII [Synergistota bacterium]